MSEYHDTDFLIMEYFGHKIIKMFLEERKGCIDKIILHLMNAWKAMLQTSDGVFADEMRNFYILMSLIMTCSSSNLQVDQLNSMLEMIKTQGQELKVATEEVSNVFKFLHTKIFLKLLDNGCGKGAKQYLHDHDVLHYDLLEQFLVSKGNLPENLKSENLKNVCFTYVSEVYRKTAISRLVLLLESLEERNNDSQAITLIPKGTETIRSSSSEPIPNSYQTSTGCIQKVLETRNDSPSMKTSKDSPCIRARHKLTNSNFQDNKVEMKYSKRNIHTRKSFKFKGSYKKYNTRSDKKVSSNIDSHMYIGGFKKSFKREKSDDSRMSDNDLGSDDARSYISDSFQNENQGVKCYVDINKVVIPNMEKTPCHNEKLHLDHDKQDKLNNNNNNIANMSTQCSSSQVDFQTDFCSDVPTTILEKTNNVEKVCTSSKSLFQTQTNNQINNNFNSNHKTIVSDKKTSADSTCIRNIEFIEKITSKDYISKDHISKDHISKDHISEDRISKEYISKDHNSKDTNSGTPTLFKNINDEKSDSEIVPENCEFNSKLKASSSSSKTSSSKTISKKSVVNSDDVGVSCNWSDDETEAKHNVYAVRTQSSIRVPFSKDEEDYIKDGIKKYGIGNWCKIKESYPFHPNRTNVSIKDKFRTMKRQGIFRY